MNRRSLIASILATPLALLAGSAASKEQQHSFVISRNVRPLGIGPSPVGTPMNVIENCVVVGTFEDAPAGEVYDAPVWDFTFDRREALPWEKHASYFVSAVDRSSLQPGAALSDDNWGSWRFDWPRAERVEAVGFEAYAEDMLGLDEGTVGAITVY